MKSHLRIILTGAVLAALLIALSAAAPKRTEGTVAAAVHVVNPYVPVEPENGSRASYEYVAQISATQDTVTSPPIPADKRLVIDYVSGACIALFNDQLRPVNLLTPDSSGALNSNHFFTPLFVKDNLYGFSQQIRLYVEPGQSFGLFDNLGGAASCDVTVSGFLVNP